MDSGFVRKFELKQAKTRWQWCYWIAYLNAAYTAVTAFILYDERGNMTTGFDPLFSPLILAVAVLLGGLAWGVHRKFSMTCLIILLILTLVGAFALFQEDNAKDAIGNCIAAVFLFRGIVGVKQLKKAFEETRTSKTVMS